MMSVVPLRRNYTIFTLLVAEGVITSSATGIRIIKGLRNGGQIVSFAISCILSMLLETRLINVLVVI